ncbi:mucin-2-like [Thalassophryne amazonica]|uniref:mucin-2-like n=1 Tax=Thalassophryne amazonica TaxID=390379 RepID=UPI0014721719|nr:mucin-2-like [Thalassophryne amazonica]
MSPYPSLLSPLLGLGMLFLSSGLSSADKRPPGPPSAGPELNVTRGNCSGGCIPGSVTENATHSDSTDPPQNNLFTTSDLHTTNVNLDDHLQNQSSSPTLPIPENPIVHELNESSNATGRTESSLSTGNETLSNSSFILPNTQVPALRIVTAVAVHQTVTTTEPDKKLQTNNTLTKVTSTTTLPPLTTAAPPQPSTAATGTALPPTAATPPLPPMTTTSTRSPTSTTKTSSTTTTEAKPTQTTITVKTLPTPATKRPSSSATLTPSPVQSNTSTATTSHHAMPVPPETKVAVVVVTGADLTQQLVDTATLLAVLLFGLLFFLVTVAIFVTQAYESYRTRTTHRWTT